MTRDPQPFAHVTATGSPARSSSRVSGSTTHTDSRGSAHAGHSHRHVPRRSPARQVMPAKWNASRTRSSSAFGFGGTGVTFGRCHVRVLVPPPAGTA
jgi:hypothetical protein